MCVLPVWGLFAKTGDKISYPGLMLSSSYILFLVIK